VSVLLRLRRFRPENLTGEPREIVETIPVRSSERAFEEEIAQGILFDLGEEWNGPHAALAGAQADASTPGFQPVLGGDFLGRTETEVLVVLRPEQVACVSAFMNGLDIPGLVAANSLDIEGATGGVVDRELAGWIERILGELAHFYAGAAESGDAVLKIAYS
jgi:hypothetical protein